MCYFDLFIYIYEKYLILISQYLIIHCPAISKCVYILRIALNFILHVESYDNHMEMKSNQYHMQQNYGLFLLSRVRVLMYR